MTEYIISEELYMELTGYDSDDDAMMSPEDMGAVELVRCRDCKHYRFGICRVLVWRKSGFPPSVTVGDRYCAWGERKGRS